MARIFLEYTEVLKLLFWDESDPVQEIIYRYCVDVITDVESRTDSVWWGRLLWSFAKQESPSEGLTRLGQ